ncbi:hypothetical protein SERLADRAFT_456540 [Serpula lacrymans var. lacrymans S7.9]|uniref:Uncharacterized protein n=1 Tax=Serpula lacrymans var. lacrymans (strain S7.9) TaxID=578457 RepID=F8NHI9_SERL9|nr:uncharacterized protein SERLADRAFT_456540 [Serpula lacrymans var. lacrymans S7.9]EGO29160.1 hypothetical protein SERLADRAFT_456540 [Serpula lacrymans var. lacrymans S7.9]
MDRQSEDPYGTGRRDRTKSRAGSISGVGMGSYRAPSILETSGGLLDRPKMSPFVDEPEDMTKPSQVVPQVPRPPLHFDLLCLPPFLSVTTIRSIS